MASTFLDKAGAKALLDQFFAVGIPKTDSTNGDQLLCFAPGAIQPTLMPLWKALDQPGTDVNASTNYKVKGYHSGNYCYTELTT